MSSTLVILLILFGYGIVAYSRPYRPSVGTGTTLPVSFENPIAAGSTILTPVNQRPFFAGTTEGAILEPSRDRSKTPY